MFQIYNCLTTQHDWRLVIIAGLVCLLASFVAVTILYRAFVVGGNARVVWIAIAGAPFGCGIWTTHFIAMLAYEPGVPVGYDVSLTLLSLLLACVITSIGFATAIYAPGPWAPAAGGAIVGSGVVVMHYVGMYALCRCRATYNGPGISSQPLSSSAAYLARPRCTLRRAAATRKE